MNLVKKPQFYQHKKLVLALSGGVDSIVLLHYLKSISPLNIRTIHINHNISPNSNIWQEFCQEFCNHLGVDIEIFSIDVAGKNNLEERARTLRYKVLFNNLKSDEILLTAHHKNDQAETVLLNLFRGSGAFGLAGMLEHGKLHRPFLHTSKDEIIQYATSKNLKYITDESNFDNAFNRNFIRNEILPAIKNNYSSVVNNLARSAIIQQENISLLEDLATIDINNHNIINNNLINIKSLKNLSVARIKNVIYYHLKNINFQHPSSTTMESIIKSLDAKKDSKTLITWGEFEMRIFKGDLHFLPKNKTIRYCKFFDTLKHTKGFNIKHRESISRIKFDCKSHSQSVKKIMQEYNIPPWERDTLRFYFIFDDLIAIENIGMINK